MTKEALAKDLKLFLIKNGIECMICSRYGFDVSNHLETEHKIILDQLQGGTVAVKRLNVDDDDRKPRKSGNGWSEKQLFHCKYCKQPIYAKMNLMRHEPMCSKIHKYRDGLKCLICEQSYYESQNLNQHFRIKHKDLLKINTESATCKHCKLTFNNYSTKLAHEGTCEKWHTILKANKCLICNKSFSNHSFGLNHIKNNHRDALENLMSGQPKNTILEQPLLSQQTNVGKRDEIIDCQFCKQPIKAFSVKLHQKFCSKYGKYVIGEKCLVCKKSFKDRNAAVKHFGQLHKSKVTVSKTNICEICDQSFDYKSKLEDHIKTCGMVECTDCNQRLSIEDMDVHKSQCSTKKPESNLQASTHEKSQENQSVRSYDDPDVHPMESDNEDSDQEENKKNDSNPVHKSTNPDQEENKENDTIPDNNLESGSIKTDSKSYVCNECDKVLDLEFELAMHQKHCKKTCGFCTDKIHPLELQDHEAKCAKIKDYVHDLGCILCDKKFVKTLPVFKHIRNEHLNVIEDSRTKDKVEDSIDFEITEFPLVKVEKVNNPAVHDEVDPRIVTSLFKCPICFAKLLFFPHAQDHIARFHRISVQHQKRMNLKIEEISTLFL